MGVDEVIINLQGEWAIVYPEKLWGENTICCADVLCEYNNNTTISITRCY